MSLTGLGELLGRLFYYIHIKLGGFYTGVLLGIVALIGGIILGSLTMFWFISWISTRIRRDDHFPFADRINSLGFEIGGKRIIKAPHAKTVKESMTIILDAILWTLFKRKTLRRKSVLKSQFVFCSVAGVVILLTFGSFVSTSHALVGGVKRSYHSYIVAAQSTKNQPQLVSAQISHAVAPGPTPKQAKSAAKAASSAPKQIFIHKTDRPVEKKHVTGNNHVTEPQVKVAETQEKQGIVHKVTKHVTATVKRPLKRVEVNGHPVIESADPQKVLDTVKGAVESGANEISVKVRLNE